jgi:hypothetical protein
MIQDKFLQSLVQKQTELFNSDAPEIERVLVYRQIQDYQKIRKSDSC